MSVLFSDNFNRADAADVGAEANWDNADGSVWAIASNQLSAGSGGNLKRLFTTTSAHAAVADCKVSITRRLGTNFDGGVSVRDDGAGQASMTAYFLDIYGTNNVDVYRRVSGSETLIGTANATHANGDTYTLEVSGTGATVTLKVYKNGSLLGTLTDTDASRITAAGRCGVITFHSGDLFDDFLVEDLASGGTVNTATLTDTINVADAALDYVFVNRLLDSAVSVVDAMVASAIRQQLLQSMLAVTDGPLEIYFTHAATLTDAVDVADEALLRYVRNRLLSDGIDISDEALTQLLTGNILARVLSDTLNISDELLSHVSSFRLLESFLALTDQSMSALQRFVVLTDLLSVGDSAAALYVPDTGGIVFDPLIRIGFDQPKIDLGGYAISVP